MTTYLPVQCRDLEKPRWIHHFISLAMFPSFENMAFSGSWHKRSGNIIRFVCNAINCSPVVLVYWALLHERALRCRAEERNVTVSAAAFLIDTGLCTKIMYRLYPWQPVTSWHWSHFYANYTHERRWLHPGITAKWRSHKCVKIIVCFLVFFFPLPNAKQDGGQVQLFILRIEMTFGRNRSCQFSIKLGDLAWCVMNGCITLGRPRYIVAR